MGTRLRLLIVLVLSAVLYPANAIQIVVDLSHDADGLFASIPGATDTLEAAAADLSHYITSSLLAIPSDEASGSSGSTTVTFSLEYTYSNPFTGAEEAFSPSTLATGEYRIFAGLRNLGGALGEGGPGGVGLEIGASGPLVNNNLTAAMANAESAANSSYGRGSGPTLATFDGDLTLDSTTANYSLAIGSGIGSLWFDQNTSDPQPQAIAAAFLDLWHVDHTTPVAAGKFDLYTVALHEMVHAIGFGTMESWEDLVVNGTDWLGPKVFDLLGTDTNVLADPAHAANGFFSLNTLGELQESLMVTTLPSGTRRTLTELDLAFLEDMGWDVVPIPEPSTIVLFALAALVITWNVRRGRMS